MPGEQGKGLPGGQSKGLSRRQIDETLAKVSDPFGRNALRAAYHVRRFLVIYVCGGLIALALALLPTVASNQKVAAGAGVTGGSPYGSGANSGASANALSSSGTNPASTGANASSGLGAGPGQASGPGASSAAQGAISNTGGQVGAGVTVGGVACSPGVRQIPFSQYAAPCVSKWSGNNGGSTWNGVNGNTITIAIRHTADSTGANSVATQAEIEAAGGVQYSVAEGYTQQLVAYFNKVFELYGRQVKLVDFNGQGNYTNEELDQDQSGACADADAISSSVHAFGVIDFEGNFEPGPFAECAAHYKLYIPEGAAYFPESFYRQLNPYVWAITMNCSLISQEFADFAGRQLFPFNAKWAGNNGITSMASSPRKLAVYIPNNAGYQDCATYGKQLLEQNYGVSASRMDQYNYALDISTFPQDAQKAIVQFSANNDTSVELACDPISPIFLTQDAVQQNYYPEWVLNGVALTDTDNFAQLWDQQSINGHLFGMSQAGDTAALLSPNGEAGRVLTAAGVPVNPSSVVDYYELLPLFNQLQAAGPTLTPANIAAGSAGLPAGGSDTSPEGPWYFGPTHTLIRGSREVYWNGSGHSAADNKTGTYVSIYGGRFFQVNEFPSGQPPFYP
jgi:hypothetical protein